METRLGLCGWIGLALLLGLLQAGPIRGQVTGRVVDADSGQPIPGAQVFLEGTGVGTFTNAQGRFVLSGVPPGRYRLHVSLIGFSTQTIPIEVGRDQTAPVEIALAFEEVAFEEIVVDGPERPVYNVALDPLLSRDPVRVVSDEPTVLTFGIGPPDEESVLGGDPSVSEVIGASESPTLLTVVFECFVCTESANQLATVVYDPEAGSSDTAVFDFTARRSLVADSGGLGRVALSVLKDDVEVDRIEIPLLVGFATNQALERYRPPAVHHVNAIPDNMPDPPDLVIYVGPGAGSRALPVRLAPRDGNLAARLQAVLEQPADSVELESGVNEADLQQIAGDVYLRLSDIVLDNDSLLDKVYLGTEPGPIDLPNSARLQGNDSSAVVVALDEEGRNLFRRVFTHGEPRLRRAVGALEAYGRERLAAGSPLHIRIHNSGPWVPWQLLASTDEGPGPDPDRFWGLRYALGVRQELPGLDGPVATTIDAPEDDDVVLATHRHDRAVYRRADSVRARMVRRTGVSVLRHDQSGPLLTDLGDLADYLKVIFFFTHGSSGADDPGSIAKRPELRFSDTDVLTPPRVDALGDSRPPAENAHEAVFFRSQPLVFLNACESGTGGLRPGTNNNFVASFLRLGASAVIATESSVWVGFAYRFADDVVAEVLDGTSMALAMQRARRKHLAERGNILGLAYSLYGNPSAHLTPPDPRDAP